MPSKKDDLYDRQLASYRAALKRDPEAALDRFGMTMINSLNPAERALAMRHFGVEAADSVDFYNLGVHFAQEENWTEAIDYFKRAVEANPELTQAIHNLALCYERTGHTPQAKSTWKVFLDATNDSSERSRIEQHLESLD